MTRYAAPRTVDEAVQLVADRPGARLVAGGTDLVVAARVGKRPLPGSLVAVHGITELAGRRDLGDGLELGALTTHAWLERAPDIRTRWSALADAAAMVGSPATRATGTIGGNLMNASPAMDTGSPLLVLGATVELRHSEGSRSLSVADLLAGPGRTTAAAGELLTTVFLPVPAPGTGSAYVRLGHRKAMEIAIVGAAAALGIGSDGLIVSARVALTAVAPTCLEVPDVAEILVGHRPAPSLFAAAARVAAAAVQPISDVRASAEYRRAMTSVVLQRALTSAAHRAADAGSQRALADIRRNS